MLASILFPYDDDAAKLIDKWLGQLADQGCIIRYSAEGDSYIKIVKWESHQKVDRPSNSKIPDPREPSCPPREPSRALPVGSEDQGSEDQGGDRLGRASGEDDPPAPEKKSNTRGTRLPPDWDIPTEWGTWAEDQGMTRAAIIREADKFKDYWLSKSGSGATKTDWQATWRNWIRKHLEEYAA
jgi:hypothetical protein